MDLINETKDEKLIKPDRFKKPAESSVLIGFQRVSPVCIGLITQPIRCLDRTAISIGSRSDRFEPGFKTMTYGTISLDKKLHTILT